LLPGESFDVDISGWRVDAALDMERMFASCHAFNQPLGEWQVGQVQTMEYCISYSMLHVLRRGTYL
jgi:hypothetical protein